MEALNTLQPKVLSVLRIVAGLTFLSYGTQKILNFPAASYEVGFFTMPWFAGIIELAAGALIMIGLFTRPAAFLASGLMAAAYFIAHAPQDFFPSNNGGTAAILFCFIFLYLVFSGAGPWSVDAKMKKG